MRFWFHRLPIKMKRLLLVVPLILVGGFGMASDFDYPLSDHFDGERFFNPGNVGQKKFSDFVRVLRERNKKPWPDWLENAKEASPKPRNDENTIQLTYVNHATVLIQFQGRNILTDPIWSERCSPVSFAGPKRHRAPGVAFDRLPVIHAVLISHNHYDHLDLPTLRRLHQRDRPLIIAGIGTRPFLEAEGFDRVVELDWWQKHESESGVAFHFVPAQHWSKRNFFGQNEMLWGGFVIKSPRGGIFFAGDTGYGKHFGEVNTRLGPFDAALLPIGAYKPVWFMENFHMGPSDAVQAFHDLNRPVTLAIHHGTFPLGAEGHEDAHQDLLALKEAAGDGLKNFHAVGNGSVLKVPLKGPLTQSTDNVNDSINASK